MMRLKIGIVRGAVAICLASTAIGGVVLALDGPVATGWRYARR